MKLRNLFVIPQKKKNRSQFTPTSVKCYGCERAKDGGASCQDHGSVLQLIWQPQKVQDQAILRQQQMMMMQAIQQMPYQNSPIAQMQAQQQVPNIYWTSQPYPMMDRYAIAKTEAELVAGPILAFRAWSKLGPLLSSAGVGNRTWNPGEPMTGDVTAHGVYAWASPKPLEEWASGAWGKYVYGGVWLWGDVIEHERGYRASHGYPAFLWAAGILLSEASPIVSNFSKDRTEYICGGCGALLAEAMFPLVFEGIVPHRHKVEGDTPHPSKATAAIYGIPVIEVASLSELEAPDKEKLLFEESDSGREG